MKTLLVILLNIVFNFIVAIFVTLLWNYTLPELFQLPEITYIKSFCLLLLVQLLLYSKITYK